MRSGSKRRINFTIAIGPTRGQVMGLDFATFLAPGLLMMTVIQNAFANTSSSIMAAKVQGNIVDTLMPPLSAGELVLGYLAGGVARGLALQGLLKSPRGFLFPLRRGAATAIAAFAAPLLPAPVQRKIFSK